MTALDRVLGRLDSVVASGAGWKACCPAHPDTPQGRGLSVSVGQDGRVLLYCHSGCPVEKVVEAAGLTFNDLSTGPTLKPVKARRKLRVDGDLYNEVYTALLNCLKLSSDHAADLVKRGLDNEAIRTGGYKSLGSVDPTDRLLGLFHEDQLSQVPGLTKRDGTIGLSVGSGLAIPVRSRKGAIRGIQVRTDGGASKYIWLSGGKGPPVGSPVHHPLVGGMGQPTGRVGQPGRGGTVRITEGPLKADVVSHLSGHAYTIAVPGVSAWVGALQACRFLEVSRVLLALDSDHVTKPAVRRQMTALATALQESGLRVGVETWEGYKGLDDALLAKAEITEWPSAKEYLSSLPPFEEDEDTAGDDSFNVVLPLNAIDPAPVEWVWPGWLPVGAVSLLDGDPGLGKSQIAYSVCAAVTRGSELPGKAANGLGSPADVVVMSAEDDHERTQAPRLLAAGADSARVHLFRYIRDRQGRRLPSLPHDIERLEEVVRTTNSKLLVVDPLFAYIGSEIDSHRDDSIRRVMSRLAQLAEERQVAILVLRHLNKSSGGAAIYRGGGSIGVIGACRAAWMVGRDPSRPAELDRGVLAVTKANLAKVPTSLHYEVVQQTVGGLPTSRVEWGLFSDLRADELVGDSKRAVLEERTLDWLSELLAAGPKTPEEVGQACRVAGFSFGKLNKMSPARLKEAGIVKTDTWGLHVPSEQGQGRQS